MKFLLLNDLHLSAKAPVSRTDDWQETLFGKLDQVQRLAEKLDVRAVCIAGDLFHLKSRVPYSLVYRFLTWVEKLKQHNTLTLAIPGNHDEQYDRYESIATQPIGVLFESGAVIDVSFTAHEFRDAEGSVAVVGIPYPAAKDLDQYAKLPKHAASHAILMAHCFATPEGGDFFGEPVLAYKQLVSLPYDVFHFGHDHRDHGVVKVAGSPGDRPKWFVNLGALGRGSIAQEDLNRDVKIALVTTGTQAATTVQQVKLKIAPASDVFDLALKAQQDHEREQIAQFVNQLAQDLVGAGPVDLPARVQALQLPDAVRQRVLTYLEGAEHGE